jgi:hypothetical protein
MQEEKRIMLTDIFSSKSDNDELKIIVRDNLSSLSSFRVSLIGSYTSGE